MKIPMLMKSKLGMKIYSSWADIAVNYITDIKDSNAVEAYFFLKDPSTVTIMKKLPRQAQATLSNDLRLVSRDKAVVNEMKADKRFQYFTRKIQRVKNKKAGLKLIPKLEAYITEYTDTRGAEKAKAAIAIINKM